MTKQFHEAGVYMIRNRQTGDCYIGASGRLGQRLRQHLTMILNRQDVHGANYGRRPPFEGVFCGCVEADVEFRILELVEIPATEDLSLVRRRYTSSPGIARLLDREEFWIKKLRPSLNVKGARGPIDIKTIPVGEPQMMPHGAAAK